MTSTTPEHAGRRTAAGAVSELSARSTTKRVLVVGAGATGGYFGARLAQAGRDVTFLVRPGRAAALRTTGLRLSGPDGDEAVIPRLVTAQELADPYDVILLAVKAEALDTALTDVTPAVGESSVIIPFLNGIDHLKALTERFPGSVLGGVVRAVAHLAADGAVIFGGPTAVMEIGELTGEVSDRVRAAAGVLASAGFAFSVSDDIRTAMWHKWVFISTVSVITCLMTGTIGEVAAVPGGPDFAAAVLEETTAVAAGAKHPLSAAQVQGLRTMMTQEGSPFAPSMYRDMTDQRPTEVEHVLASLSSAATDLDIPTPLVDLAVLRLRVHNRKPVTPS
ncbi:ketopantoate reductase family protein [Streptomyces canus]|uniref:ketopantoate reductase family protein n=1 Tax=Streptomyces canus TaxID=58343 RepID=UPI003813A16D